MNWSSRNLLESGIAIQSQVVLDHSVGSGSRHLLVGHLVSGQVLCGETTAVDAGLEVIRLAALRTQLGEVNAVLSILLDLRILGDLSEMNHGVCCVFLV